MSAPCIRLAVAADLPAINEIHNHYVLHSTCTYQYAPDTLETRQRWFADHGEAHPVTVAQVDGRIVGWGSLSPFHRRPAYARTVEDSIYVHHDFHGRRIGSALLADLIQRARKAGHHSVMALISAEQSTSVAMHQKHGFIECARLREVGWKFDQWLDVIYLQLLLDR